MIKMRTYDLALPKANTETLSLDIGRMLTCVSWYRDAISLSKLWHFLFL